jgi:hypothetical protein
MIEKMVKYFFFIVTSSFCQLITSIEKTEMITFFLLVKLKIILYCFVLLDKELYDTVS